MWHSAFPIHDIFCCVSAGEKSISTHDDLAMHRTKTLATLLIMATPSKTSIRHLELLWWLITFLILVAVLVPIYLKVDHYDFYLLNSVFIIGFITFTRYIFFLPFTWLAHTERWKVILFFLCIPFLFYLLQGINQFQVFLDEEGPEALIKNLQGKTLSDMTTYIRSEMLLFGVGSIISGLIFPFRLLISVWRKRNRGSV